MVAKPAGHVHKTLLGQVYCNRTSRKPAHYITNYSEEGQPDMGTDTTHDGFARLVEIMAQLRDPDTGCPWDLEQDFRSIRHNTIEEAYEVADAIEREDYQDLVSELGDLILQPVFHAQMAAEAGLFTIDDVVGSIIEKLVRRHPHIFESRNEMSSDGVLNQWEDIKEEERKERAKHRGTVQHTSILDDVPATLPPLMRAEKLAKRAARVGFDWPDVSAALDKVQEELDELRAELAGGNSKRSQEELGDLLFAIVAMARKASLSASAALAEANVKFIRRFQEIEARCRADGVDISTAGLDPLQQYWDAVKQEEG